MSLQHPHADYEDDPRYDYRCPSCGEVIGRYYGFKDLRNSPYPIATKHEACGYDEDDPTTYPKI